MKNFYYILYIYEKNELYFKKKLFILLKNYKIKNILFLFHLNISNFIN